jgi:hypothetical protein
MKLVRIIIFKDDKEFSQFASVVCEKMQTLDSDKEFCGIWGEIQSNEGEVLNSMSATVNYFIESDKKEIIFGCCEKDYNNILTKLNLEDCNVNKIDVDIVITAKP